MATDCSWSTGSTPRPASGTWNSPANPTERSVSASQTTLPASEEVYQSYQRATSSPPTGAPRYTGTPGSHPGIGDGDTPAARPGPPWAAASKAQNDGPEAPASGPG